MQALMFSFTSITFCNGDNAPPRSLAGSRALTTAWIATNTCVVLVMIHHSDWIALRDDGFSRIAIMDDYDWDIVLLMILS